MREAYHQQREELELLRRRIFVAKAERIDTNQLQMKFEAKEAEVEALKKTLDESSADASVSTNNDAAVNSDAANNNNNNNNGSNSTRPNPPISRAAVAT